MSLSGCTSSVCCFRLERVGGKERERERKAGREAVDNADWHYYFIELVDSLSSILSLSLPLDSCVSLPRMIMIITHSTSE